MTTILCAGCRQTIGTVNGAVVDTRQPTRFNASTGSFVIVCARTVKTPGRYTSEHICRRENPLPLTREPAA